MKCILQLLICSVLLLSCEKKRCYQCTFKDLNYPDTAIVMKSAIFCEMTKSDIEETIITNNIPTIYYDTIVVYHDMHCD